MKEFLSRFPRRCYRCKRLFFVFILSGLFQLFLSFFTTIHSRTVDSSQESNLKINKININYLFYRKISNFQMRRFFPLIFSISQTWRNLGNPEIYFFQFSLGNMEIHGDQSCNIFMLEILECFQIDLNVMFVEYVQTCGRKQIINFSKMR